MCTSGSPQPPGSMLLFTHLLITPCPAAFQSRQLKSLLSTAVRKFQDTGASQPQGEATAHPAGSQYQEAMEGSQGQDTLPFGPGSSRPEVQAEAAWEEMHQGGHESQEFDGGDAGLESTHAGPAWGSFDYLAACAHMQQKHDAIMASQDVYVWRPESQGGPCLIAASSTGSKDSSNPAHLPGTRAVDEGQGRHGVAPSPHPHDVQGAVPHPHDVQGAVPQPHDVQGAVSHRQAPAESASFVRAEHKQLRRRSSGNVDHMGGGAGRGRGGGRGRGRA